MLDSYVAFDLETTGLSSRENEIIEIGALKVKNGKVVERFMEFVKPSVHKELPSKSLEALCCHYCIENKAAHRAYYDALATAKLYQILAHYYEDQCPKVFIPKHLVYQPKRKKG